MPPSPVANEEKRESSAFVRRFRKDPASPVVGVDPPLEIGSVALGSPGKDILGVGSSRVMALPAEASTLV